MIKYISPFLIHLELTVDPPDEGSGKSTYAQYFARSSLYTKSQLYYTRKSRKKLVAQVSHVIFDV
jgi:hypothetical protein